MVNSYDRQKNIIQNFVAIVLTYNLLGLSETKMDGCVLGEIYHVNANAISERIRGVIQVAKIFRQGEEYVIYIRHLQYDRL